jgi:hypothetical protein
VIGTSFDFNPSPGPLHSRIVYAYDGIGTAPQPKEKDAGPAGSAKKPGDA